MSDPAEAAYAHGPVREEGQDLPELARTIEALLFLSSDPLSVGELTDATQADALHVAAAA